MSRYIPDALRTLVAERANTCCEYCLLPELYSFFSFHVDHIISVKHGGETEADNLAYACTLCNRNKGADLGTILIKNGPLIPFSNPEKTVGHLTLH
ncbi:MAG: HNH endonuclease [Saprospiraceae bacterium]